MKTQYFKPNWAAINKAIPDNLKELRQAQKELEKKIQGKVNDCYREKKKLEVAEKIAELKELPMYSEVYYIGKGDTINFGAKGKKIRDKRIRMIAEFNDKMWDCPYISLRKEPPSDQAIRDNELGKHFSRVFNNMKL
jgi:hypothetical protein